MTPPGFMRAPLAWLERSARDAMRIIYAVVTLARSGR